METLATLTWPGAFAVLGSVITVVTGLIALFLYHQKAQIAVDNTTAMKSQLPSIEVAQIHSRISELKDRVGELDGEQKVLVVKLENITKQLEDHNSRDVDDFKVINQKVDKLMEIIVEMLKGDH